MDTHANTNAINISGDKARYFLNLINILSLLIPYSQNDNTVYGTPPIINAHNAISLNPLNDSFCINENIPITTNGSISDNLKYLFAVMIFSSLAHRTHNGRLSAPQREERRTNVAVRHYL
jgi:hypothetical protein